MNDSINSSAKVPEGFYVVAHEAGAEHPALPTWANNKDNILSLPSKINLSDISKEVIHEVPGAFQLLNVLSKTECQQLISATEGLGYIPDAAVSLPRDIRHNDSLTWVVDETTDTLIWDRVKHLMDDHLNIFDGKAALGINRRYRFYRYNEGDYFKPHTDGSWPGSIVENEQLIPDGFGDRYSYLTFLILLSDNFEGGATQFWVNADNPTQPAKRGDNVQHVNVKTPAGSVLCFPHGLHPLHCIHSSEPIYKGTKYIIRTDVLFEL